MSRDWHPPGPTERRRSARSGEEPSTCQLLERGRDGDAQAVEELCRRYLPRLKRWARGRLPRFARSLVDTDDLVQEVLERTVRRAVRPESPAPLALQAYARAALTNRIRDETRRRVNKPGWTALDEQLEGKGRSPLEELIDKEQIDRYEAALQLLSPGDREAIVARLEMGCRYAEVADALGKPSPEAARKAVSRAVLRLAREMSDGG